MKSIFRIAVILFGLSTLADLQALAQSVVVDHVPSDAASRPFFAASVDLDAYGYREDEYFVAGSGDVYEYGPGNQVQLQTPDVPYKTRILIRRPENPSKFNGVVLFELMNPTAGFDIDFEWHFNRELLLEDGFIWVGLTMHSAAIGFLQFWDNARYASLSMPDLGLAYSIYAQVAELLRNPAHPENPLSDYEIRFLVGTGYSQTADYLTTFSNEFHSSHFDGYLHAGGNGAARRINSADSEFYLDDRRFNDVSAPMIRLQSETEVAVFSRPSTATRQPDSDLFRLYEVAGGSHADLDILTRTGEVISRDIGGPVLPPCANPLSPLAMGPMHRGSLALLTRWLADGTPPPPGRLIETDAMDEVIRDVFGNALGGLRPPDIAVPLGQFVPSNVGILPCPLAGSFFAFDDATLQSLYPRHGDYVSQVSQSVEENRQQGHLLRDDAVDFILKAAQSGVGK